MAKRTHNGHVYFIQAGNDGAIKIGFAIDPRKRLAELQTGNPFKLTLRAFVPGTPALERELHARFQPWRLSGEWFQPAVDVLEHVEAIEAGVWTSDAAGEEVLQLTRLCAEGLAIDRRRLIAAGIALDDEFRMFSSASFAEWGMRRDEWFVEHGSFKQVAEKRLRQIGLQIYVREGRAAVWQVFKAATSILDSHRLCHRLEIAWEGIAGIAA